MRSRPGSEASNTSRFNQWAAAEADSASLGSEANDGDNPSGALLVLDGELAVSGPDIAVLIRLTAPHSTAPVWSDRFVVRTNELFSAEDVIAERVVAALDLRLAAVEQDRLRRRYTNNGAAPSGP